jgi:hypothetical protein
MERTRVHRVYTPDVVPGVVQTEAYARAVLETAVRFRGTEETAGSLVEAAQVRVDRSRPSTGPGARARCSWRRPSCPTDWTARRRRNT